MTRFSQTYLVPDKLGADSTRMRVRLGAVLRDLVDYEDRFKFQEHLTRALGVNLNGLVWSTFFEAFELRDVLDSVSGGFEFLFVRYGSARIDRAGDNGRRARAWLEAARKIFREEHLSYRIDDAAVVHLAVDEEFERSRMATIEWLGSPRHNATRHEFEAAYDALAKVPVDGKLAIRGVFAAVETLFKLMFPDTIRLGGQEVRAKVSQVVGSLYVDNPAAKRAAEKAVRSFGEWVEGAHFYRHAQGEEEPSQPPLEVTILLVSSGSSFLRWLLNLDEAIRTNTGSA